MNYRYVSIRSRPEGREILSPLRRTIFDTRFQSALAPKDERYDLLTGPRRRSPLFQSALAPKDERYWMSHPRATAYILVSIRSRPEGREIRWPFSSLSRPIRFQSALAPKDERYGIVPVIGWRFQGFNPLSPRRTRDTLCPSWSA